MRIGLALGGGALRGIAHIGVLSVLIQAGIKIDSVAGSSAGSIMGALYTGGVPIEIVEASLEHFSWRQIIQFSRTKRGWFSLDRLERWLMMMIGDMDFADLSMPFAVVAMDITSGERLVLKKGRVAPAVRASCSIPGVMNPVELEGRLLVDGGIIDNLPTYAARQLGADFIIGVDVVSPKFDRGWGPPGMGLAAIESLVKHAGGGINTADFIISPDTGGRTYMRFSEREVLLNLGKKEARKRLPALLDAIDKYAR